MQHDQFETFNLLFEKPVLELSGLRTAEEC